MAHPTLEQIDDIRKTGFTPTVVVCFIADNKILLFLKRDYRVWMLPQTAIPNNTSLTDTINSKLQKKIPDELLQKLKGELEVLHVEIVPFAKKHKQPNSVVSDDGSKLVEQGKCYIAVLAPTAHTSINVEETDFDDYFWMDYTTAKYISEQTYLKDKGQMMLTIFDKLKAQGFLH